MIDTKGLRGGADCPHCDNDICKYRVGPIPRWISRHADPESFECRTVEAPEGSLCFNHSLFLRAPKPKAEG